MACQSPPENLKEVQLGDVREEIVEVLQSWLDREVKDRYQQIDQKLDFLVAAVLPSPRANARKPPNLLSPRAPKAVRKGETRRLSGLGMSPKRRISTDTVATTVAFDDACLLPPRISRSQTSGTLSSPREESNSRETSQEWLGIKDLFRNGVSAWNKSSVLSVAESPPPRRKLTSQRYMHEVQEFIAQHQGRGHRAVLIWRFLENPYSSLSAWLYSVFIPIFVLTSVVISFLQTVQDSPLRGGVGMWMQAGFESVYAAELIVRFFVCPDRVTFFCSVYNWIDVASAMPLVLRIFVDRDELENDEHVSMNWAKSIVVTLPLVRLLKIIRRFEQFQLLMNAFSMAGEALPVLLYTLMLIALFFSVLIFFIEPMSSIGSLPTSLWFIFVTMTTVGYGDYIPTTIGGHFITVLLMICSFLYMAIPIGIVGKAFSQVWGNRDRLLLMHRIRESFLQEGFTAESMKKIVAFFDEDGDGELDLYEFKVMLQTMHVDISEERVMQLHNEIDKDGDGTINVVELINSLFPRGYFEAWRHSIEPYGHGLDAALDDSFISPPPRPPIVVSESPQAARERLSLVSEDTSTDPPRSANQSAGVTFGPRDSIEPPPVTVCRDSVEAPPVTLCWVK